ncbi:hypothetical protein Y032_0498g2526 [Ancylostoma ceylanicum]|uniref:Uncharacterized protein n=1 Tax=Ancylostoma ceylanicum TaxID=53326 RepID=A0A016WW65_9BILA|nr:hypothetical protein Y032_0498g2526 [Ancylostoma ceylanicum]
MRSNRNTWTGQSPGHSKHEHPLASRFSTSVDSKSPLEIGAPSCKAFSFFPTSTFDPDLGTMSSLIFDFFTKPSLPPGRPVLGPGGPV